MASQDIEIATRIYNEAIGIYDRIKKRATELSDKIDKILETPNLSSDISNQLEQVAVLIAQRNASVVNNINEIAQQILVIFQKRPINITELEKIGTRVKNIALVENQNINRIESSFQKISNLIRAKSKSKSEVKVPSKTSETETKRISIPSKTSRMSVGTQSARKNTIDKITDFAVVIMNKIEFLLDNERNVDVNSISRYYQEIVKFIISTFETKTQIYSQVLPKILLDDVESKLFGLISGFMDLLIPEEDVSLPTEQDKTLLNYLKSHYDYMGIMKYDLKGTLEKQIDENTEESKRKVLEDITNKYQRLIDSQRDKARSTYNDLLFETLSENFDTKVEEAFDLLEERQKETSDLYTEYMGELESKLSGLFGKMTGKINSFISSVINFFERKSDTEKVSISIKNKSRDLVEEKAKEIGAEENDEDVFEDAEDDEEQQEIEERLNE